MNDSHYLDGAESQALISPAASGVRTVPFDYVLTFDLKGEPGRVIPRVLNISTVGTFSVAAIGYGLLIDERVTPRRFGPVGPHDLVERPPAVRVPAVVLPGLLFEPDREDAVEVAGPSEVGISDDEAADSRAESAVDASVTGTHTSTDVDTSRLIKILGAPGATVRGSINGRAIKGEDGTTTIVLDQGGRALIATNALGFEGSGTLILEDVANGIQSRPIYVAASHAFLVSAPHFGLTPPVGGGKAFDVIGVPGTQADVRIDRPGADRVPRFRGQITIPAEGSEPGVARVAIADLNNGPKRKGAPAQTREELKDEQEAFRLRAGDVVTLSPAWSDHEPIESLAPTSVTIGATTGLQLTSVPITALRGGFRLNNTLLDRIIDGVDPTEDELAEPFVRCGSGCGDLNFLYTIADNGTGRAFQNEPVHNIAGLGIANGDRPFRTLAHPIVFEPRSVILFQVQEISGGPGTLYIVLQGYKVVGAGRQRFGFEG